MEETVSQQTSWSRQSQTGALKDWTRVKNQNIYKYHFTSDQVDVAGTPEVLKDYFD